MTQELRKLAEAATQGKWKSSGFSVNSKEHGWATIANTEFDYDGMAENAAYIAAANPAAILSLLDRLEKAEKDAARLDYLQQGLSVELLYYGGPNPDFRIGGRWLTTDSDLRTAIDSAMEASK